MLQPSPQSMDELKMILAEARKEGTAPTNGEPPRGPGCDAAMQIAASFMIAERLVVLCSADGLIMPNLQ